MFKGFFKKRVYLDYAAGAEGNPSSPHEEGRRAKKQLEDARRDIARLVEVQTDDVVFTSGATEANALAILGLLRHAQKEGGVYKKLHALYLPSAHASIVENMKLLAEERIEIDVLPIAGGRVDTDALAKMLKPETVLVSMEAVCGETGVIWNTREVAQVLTTFRTGIREKESIRAARPNRHSFSLMPVLHVDASQAMMTEKMTRAHFDADLLTLDGSKVGARGIGALIAHRTIPLLPLYRGGGQEQGLRSGTESPELAQKFATLLGASAAGREEFRASAVGARARLIETVTKTIPNIFVNEGRKQAPYILNISLPGRDTDYLVALLDDAGFAVSTRSACETDSEHGSRAVLALTGDPERAKATLRISWGPATSSRDLDGLALAIAKSIELC